MVEAYLPAATRELVLEDQQRRSAICWHVFDDSPEADHLAWDQSAFPPYCARSYA